MRCRWSRGRAGCSTGGESSPRGHDVLTLRLMISIDELRVSPLFADLPERELMTLADRAADVRLAPDEWLI